MTGSRRDRLRELLDAVLDENNATLDDMAHGAYASPWHFSRQFSLGTGESPVALRRRVMLERAAWQLRSGAGVTEAAFAAGYDSVEGFSRAFSRAYGYPPSVFGTRDLPPTPVAHWLPAPNGVHFHPPMHLWVEDEGLQSGRRDHAAAQVTAQLVHHDLDDTRLLLEFARDLDHDEYTRPRFPGLTVLEWDGPDESIAEVLGNLVWSKEIWLASMAGADQPVRGDADVAALQARFDVVAPQWAETVRDIERRGAWGDRLIDALCVPPESFVLGSVIAHVLTFSAHRRQLVRHMLRAAGRTVDHGDPIEWQRGVTPEAVPPEQERA
ncbi:helix-turn-helix domain-containing protein [Rhodococcus chondri]|uniref:Helix-turn-helix domain-containing protein n=1 Tax=Rhodococcus chondri TaxID=3065941 RepID=A0ABU7JX70_9NOCA|nr:helix-turn-helix domain-containing protein [Rhodococcus sp. CC-R104]MEE2034480.1 helix-turn-helix domain-containing protein [Rhodococcus sp. CC-R104]